MFSTILVLEMWWTNLTSFISGGSRPWAKEGAERGGGGGGGVTLHFAVAWNIVYKSNTRERTWQVETVEQTEQCHIKFVETSHYLKLRGRKAFPPKDTNMASPYKAL